MDNSPTLTHLLDDNSQKPVNINEDNTIISTSNVFGDVNYSPPTENGQTHDKVDSYCIQ